MHFIGNRAIILGGGENEYQLVYHPGYTVLSVFLPIIGLTIAFSAAELPAKSHIIHWIALFSTGIFAGLSIVGMHYLGNFGVRNYHLTYNPRYLAASIVIAIGDCLGVLVLFYKLRDKWISSWWKRVLCATALAGGVTAMHFTGATDCRYENTALNDPAAVKSRDIQIIVAGVLCGAAALMVLGVLLITRARHRMQKSRSQKVMLACAMFDPDGRVLVTTEGILPSREITDKYHHRTFDEDFDTAHPVFQWIFRVTHNWAGVSELIPKMRSHLAAEKSSMALEPSSPSSSQSSAIYDAATYSNYELLFRERFCAAASSLATSLHLPVEHIGVLYDQTIQTGTLRVETKEAKRKPLTEERTLAEVEAALKLSLFGKGQLLFITRELARDQTDKLLNSGFRFASAAHVSRTIAQAMQIPQSTLEAHVKDLRQYVDLLHNMTKPGTYLAFFAMIPKPNSKGFDIVVKKECQDQLPDVPLLPDRPYPWQAAFLDNLEGLRVQQCIEYCEECTHKEASGTQQERQFAVVVKQAIIILTQRFPAEWRNEARFWAKPLHAHYSQILRTGSPVTTLYAFTVIGDMHASVGRSQSFTRVPMSFFDTRHRCYAGSPDHSALTQDIHATFAPLFARRIPKPNRTHRHRRLSTSVVTQQLRRARTISVSGAAAVKSKTSPSRGSSVDHTDEASSMCELMDKPLHPSDFTRGTQKQRDNNWGGILVNSETVIKTDSKNEFLKSSSGEEDNNKEAAAHIGVGTKVAVSTAKPEVTFVDELVGITKARFLPVHAR